MSDFLDLSTLRTPGFGASPAPEHPPVDLIAEMARPTDQVADAVDPDEAQPDPNDFDEGYSQAGLGDDPDGDLPPPDPAPNKSFWRSQARMWVNAFNTLQQSVLGSYVYPKAILEPADRRKLNRFKEKSKGKRKEDLFLDDDIQAVLDRYAELDSQIGKLPFSADEKETLTAPLADLLAKHQQGKLSPEVALLIAVSIVMIPRLAPGLPLVLGKQK